MIMISFILHIGDVFFFTHTVHWIHMFITVLRIVPMQDNN